MNTRHLYFLFFVLVALGAWMVVQRYYSPRAISGLPLKVLTLNGATVNARVAVRPTEQKNGLMGIASLTDEDAMLFPFHPARRVSFWNQGMRMPFDLIWIKDGRVSGIEANFPKLGGNPITKASSDLVDHALELGAGWADRHGTRVGDQIFGL